MVSPKHGLTGVLGVPRAMSKSPRQAVRFIPASIFSCRLFSLYQTKQIRPPAGIICLPVTLGGRLTRSMRGGFPHEIAEQQRKPSSP
jgi:hypothetical protein